MPNPGKIFEEDFSLSFEPYKNSIGIDRFYDVMGGRKGIGTIADYVVYKYPHQFYFELKSYEGSSIPFDAFSETQWEGLKKKAQLPGVFAGGLLNFRTENGALAYWVDIRDLVVLRDVFTRKSIPLYAAICLGVELFGKKKRTRYTYDVLELLHDIKERGNKYAYRQ